jgi:hypothetical protein
MATQIQLGMKAKTLGPLKPTGRVSIDGHTMDASSEGMWIDGDVNVVIVGGCTRQVIVRVYSNDGDLPPNSGQQLPEENAIETTPLRAPPAWVERIHSVKIGIVIGIVLVPIAWMLGTPMSSSAILVPVSCAMAGWLLQMFVGRTVEMVGPREDHRPLARATALIVLCCSLVGAAVGVNFDTGFLGLSCGIPAGALVGGVMTFVGWIVSNV